jgi:hypothetical protein
MTTNITDEPKVPYILFYRQGNNPYPQFLMFHHASGSRDMRPVVERAKKHCELMNYRFTNVRPFLVDLDEAESRALGQSNQGQSA